MRSKTKSSKAKQQPSPRKPLPLRWEDVPHQQILLKALHLMKVRSAARAADDARRSLLKRQLPKNEPFDHKSYIETESAFIVETLRHLRDQYRVYLEECGCHPIAEMYWVVVRHGIKDWAVMVLRAAAVKYITASCVDKAKWEALFDFPVPYNQFLLPALASQLTERTDDPQEKLSKTIEALLPQTAFDQIIDGGPFGREHQIYFARSFPGRAFFEGRETFEAVIERRQRSWDEARPWSEGLANLFEVTQQEIFAQFDGLREDAKEAEVRFVHLSDFQQIVYNHLVGLAHSKGRTEATAKDRWVKLFSALDQAGILPGETLEGIARETLMAVLRKGTKLRTWQDCYASATRVTLEDGKVRTLRREVTHALHNAAQASAYQVEKVWVERKVPR